MTSAIKRFDLDAEDIAKIENWLKDLWKPPTGYAIRTGACCLWLEGRRYPEDRPPGHICAPMNPSSCRVDYVDNRSTDDYWHSRWWASRLEWKYTEGPVGDSLIVVDRRTGKELDLEWWNKW